MQDKEHTRQEQKHTDIQEEQQQSRSPWEQQQALDQLRAALDNGEAQANPWLVLGLALSLP